MTTQCMINQEVADLAITATNNLQCKLSDLRGKPVILFFYPKDNTPVCTAEAKDFRNHFEKFKDINAVILGISRDSLGSHERFKTRLELPFELISDANEEFCKYFDVLKEKNFFGKKFRGIVRSSFLIDKEGILRKEWRKIKISGHIDEIFKALNELS